MLHIKRIINASAHYLAINSKNINCDISWSFVPLIVKESYFFSKKRNKIKEKHLKTIKLRTRLRTALLKKKRRKCNTKHCINLQISIKRLVFRRRECMQLIRKLDLKFGD